MIEQKITLESMKKQQAALRKEISRSKARIAKQWDFLFTPPQPNTKVEALVSNAEKAYAVYDGVMTGYKLFRRFNALVGFFRKKKAKGKK